MKPIPILGIGLQSHSSNVTAQSRVNCYMDNSDDKNIVVAIGTPGLRIANYFGGFKIRGMYECQGSGFVVHGSDVYILDRIDIFPSYINVSTQLIGTLTTVTGFVDFSDNGIEVTICDNGIKAYTYNLASGTFLEITDPDFPLISGFQSTAFLDSFTLVNKPVTQQFQWSSSYDSKTWDATDIATAESYPDNIVRIVTHGGYVYIFGRDSVEFWSTDVSGFSVIKGLTLSYGLSAVQSVAKVSAGLICLTSNKNGTSQISVVSPGSIKKVSTSDIDFIVNGFYDITDATGFSYVMNGHEFYQINFTIVNQSWLYDLTMGLWSQLKSDGGRHFAEHVMKFDNHIYVSDYRNRNGYFYLLDTNTFADGIVPIEFELTSKHVFNGLEKVSIKTFQIDAETGLLPDTGVHQNSQMMISVSKDNGKNFSESFVSMGFPGETKTRCRKNRLGMARDWVFRVRITDRIKRIVMGAYVELN